MGELVKPGSIGYILLNSQIVTENDISAALEEQQKSGCRIGEALVRLGIVTQEDIDWALSNQLNIPYVRLKKEMIDRAAVDLLPGYICRQYGLMPIICYGNELSVAMIDPLNTEAIAAVQEMTGLTVAVSVALVRELREMQAIFYGSLEGETLDFSSPLFPAEALAKINVDLSGAKLTDYVLSYMVQQSLASLSFQPLNDRCRLIARKKGVTREIGTFPLNRYSPIQQRLRRLSGVVAEANAESGSLVFSFKGAELCVEANFLRMTGGDCITLRRRLTVPFPVSLEEFLTTDRERELLRSLLSLTRGILLCTAGEQEDLDRLIDFCLDGIAGNGKSVVLMGDRIGRSRSDSPRVDCSGVTSSGFSALLNALLEHEPEVIAIEDVSREHLLLGAGKASLRGRLVMGGMPGFDSATIFTTLRQLWRHHHFVPDSIKGIINCRAVHLLCSSCRQSYVPSGEELAAMGLVNPPQQFYAAAGCKECGQSGYASKKYLLEVIAMTPELLQSVERSVDGCEVVQFLNSRGLTGVRAQGIALLDAGDISPQEFISELVL